MSPIGVRVITVDVDGEPHRFHVAGAVTEDDLEAMRDLVRAARRAAAEPDQAADAATEEE